MLFRNGVRGMRGDRWNDQFVPLPAFDEPLDVGHRLFMRLVVSDGKINDSFSENSSHACLRSFIGDCILEVVHIAVRSRTAANHFGETETRANANKLFGDVLRL